MLNKDIESFLARGLSLMDLPLANQPEVLTCLALYFQELVKWNRKVNLVARSLAADQILENHFLDSLTLLSQLSPETVAQETLLDVGTGAGFPGLVLKAACPALSVTLVEPRKNRFYFLKHMIRALGLQGIEVFDVRLAEKTTVKELSGHCFSFITSRAFTDSAHFIELAAPYLEKGGRIVLMKGPAAAGELHAAGGQLLSEKFYVADVKRLSLPFSKGERWLISIRRSDDKQ